jgi:hypothetical protein
MSAFDDFLNAAPSGSQQGPQSFDAYISGGAPVPLAASPLDGMSTLDQLRAGAGMGMAKIGRAVGQGVGSLIDAVAPAPQPGLSNLVTGQKPPTLSERLGFPTQASIDEANRLDAPLSETTPGKIGSVIGQTAAVLPAVLIPGAGTYAGASAIGAGIGALTTEGGIGDRAKGAVFGAAGGAAGKGLGDLVGFGFDTLAARRAAAQTANAGRDAAAVQARNAGYVLPPADTNPTITNEILNGLSGKIKTAQTASAQNQGVTNTLAKTAVGAPLDQPLSVAALGQIRTQAGKAYDAVGNAGTITPGKAYTDALDAIVAPYVKAAQGFPNAKPSPVIAAIDALRSPQFDAGSAVSQIKSLRADADAAYSAGNSDLGRALKSGAGALEDAIDAHLVGTNAPADLLSNFRNARQLIAKTYSIQKGLNDTTGDVAAKALANQLAKGKPLSGDLLTIGQTAAAFPKATQALTEAPKQLSPLDFMGALMAGTASGHPAAALGVLARPAVRSAILSAPYQAGMGVPSYQGGLLGRALQSAVESPVYVQTAPVVGGLLSSRLAQ